MGQILVGEKAVRFFLQGKCQSFGEISLVGHPTDIEYFCTLGPRLRDESALEWKSHP